MRRRAVGPTRRPHATRAYLPWTSFFGGRRTALGPSASRLVLAGTRAAAVARQSRFVREYRLAAQIRHENIVPIYDAGDAHGQLYIAMPIVGNSTLAELIKRHGSLPLDRAIAITRQVALALDAAHAQGLVHRDIKPANILIEQQGHPPRDHIYIVDFGLTLQVDATTRMTRTGAYMGTLAYMAPELLLARGLDGRADQYALACTVYQMLSGTTPFMRDNEAALITAQLMDPPPSLVAVRPDLPQALNAVLTRGLAKEPADRYPSTVAFADALASAAAAVPVADRRAVPMTAAVAPPQIAHDDITVRDRTMSGAPPSGGRRTAMLGAALIAIGVLAVIAYGALAFLGAPPPGGTTSAVGSLIAAGQSANPTSTLPTPVGSPPPTNPAAWMVSLGTTSNSPFLGQRVTVTATANFDVGPAEMVIQILDQTGGSIIKACASGTTCATVIRLQNKVSTRTWL